MVKAKPEKKHRDTAVFSMVMPVELNEKLQQEAAVEKRTKIQQINWIVEKHFEAKEKESFAQVS